MRRIVFAVAALGMLPALGLASDTWPGWRGPTGLGYCDEKDLPLTWDGKTGANILWKAPLHDGPIKNQDFTSPGWSCPIVWKDRVFLTTVLFPPGLANEERRKTIGAHHVLCFDAKDGKRLWDTVIPHGPLVTLIENIYHGYAVPTPVTDGKHVFALFGSGVLVSLDFDGKIVWRDELPHVRDTDPGICGSPILFEDSVILPALQDKDTGLRALYKKDGKVKWQQKTKFRNTYPTPALLRIGGQLQLIHYAGGITGSDPATGEILWNCKAPSSQSSPVFGDGLLYADAGRGGQQGAAIDPIGKGDLSKTNVKWQTRVEGVSGGSAIFVDGYLYRSSGQQFIRCWSMKDGELAGEIKAPRVSPSSSPIATPDGRIYWANPGKSYVLKAGPKLEVLATNDINDGQDYTTAAIANGRIYIKGRTYLWCIGKK